MANLPFDTSAIAAPAASRPGLFKRLRIAAQLYRQRRALALLEPHLLADIGLTPYEARTEAERPLWDVPQHWTR